MSCIAPFVARAEDDISREEARQKLDATQQELKSSRVQEQGLAHLTAN